MSTEILGTWFIQVVYICGLPVVAILWALGLRQDAGMEVFKQVAVFGGTLQTDRLDGLFLVQVVCTSAMTLFLLLIYPLLVAMLYGMSTYAILTMAGMETGLNLVVTNIIGFMIGLKIGAWLMPKIDARFGIQDGMFLPLKVFLTAGTVYMGVQVLKVGKKVLTKL